ncbi:MAG: glycosyltransferase [Chloroherpetonaceae bacterium]|nr:glycosyltransferase family 4 protein [Chloroherpetonaceae bacterium]MCS7210854.1 glycosyltransferase family 4 protein [Chloroherpetonaceae bacterium]MDW8018459.1 glycosyltransferase [Chloroherpetonaceae bacterium]MDW8466406.1 glycosyltransferase [Chloroherpetonaceae bacterium]
MNILVITPYLPYPNAPSGGATLLYTLLRALSAQCNIYLAAMYEPSEEQALAQLSKWVEVVLAVEKVESSDQVAPPLPVREKTPSFWSSIQLLLGSLVQYGASVFGIYARQKPDQARFWQALVPILQSLQPDIIQVEYGHFCRLFARRLTGFGTTVGAAHDVEFKPAQRYAERANGFHRLACWAKYYALRRAELAAYRHLKKIYALSEFDAALLRQLDTRLCVGVRRAGLDVLPCPVPMQRSGQQLLFVGAMHRPENLEAVKFLRFEVMPKVWQKVPTATLHIVGKGAPSSVLRWSEGVSMQFHGYQPDLSAFYAEATAALVPLFVGGGVIVKLLEALAHGVPTVATPIANEGIGAPDGKAVLLASDADAFSQHILSLLSDSYLRQTLSLEARAFVEAHFRIEQVAQTLIDDYERLTLASYRSCKNG